MTQRNRTPIDGSSSATILNSTAKPPTSSASICGRRSTPPCLDEKTAIQALDRLRFPSYRSHRDVPNATGTSYYRHGTLSLYTASPQYRYRSCPRQNRYPPYQPSSHLVHILFFMMKSTGHRRDANRRQVGGEGFAAAQDRSARGFKVPPWYNST
jgi:hypothetical protein